MPSIPQIIALKEKYGSKNDVNLRQLKVLNENFKLSAASIQNSLTYQGLDQRMISFFERQESAHLVMLFIDITSFSTKCRSYTNGQLASYLDDYYDMVIPIIYAHGGEIEKIIGDGIIAVFGRPFLFESLDNLFSRADKCAKDLIMILRGTEKEIKVALHDGSIMYYKNKTLNYPEYTIIGKPLTELHRLESVAENNSISYYHISPYSDKAFAITGSYCVTNRYPARCGHFQKGPLKPINLQGVDWSYLHHFTCTYHTP